MRAMLANGLSRRGISCSDRFATGHPEAAPATGRRWPASSRRRRASAPGPSSGAPRSSLYEFVRFGIKQGWACLFGALMLALLIGTHLLYPQGRAGSPATTSSLIAAVAIQVAMLAFKLETWEEAKVIFIFHVVGTAMEIFKTSVGSWIYPGALSPAHRRRAAVHRLHVRRHRLLHRPLPGGCSTSASRTTRRCGRWCCWRSASTSTSSPTTTCSDARLLLFALTALLFGRCWVHFKVWQVHRRMPLLVGFALVALFIWFAENIGTFTAAWIYPNQRHGWSLVTIGKLGAWFLLMIISYVLVALVNRPQAMPAAEAERTNQVPDGRLGFQSVPVS